MGENVAGERGNWGTEGGFTMLEKMELKRFIDGAERETRGVEVRLLRGLRLLWVN
jgi:hypothetical protein